MKDSVTEGMPCRDGVLTRVELSVQNDSAPVGLFAGSDWCDVSGDAVELVGNHSNGNRGRIWSACRSMLFPLGRNDIKVTMFSLDCDSGLPGFLQSCSVKYCIAGHILCFIKRGHINVDLYLLVLPIPEKINIISDGNLLIELCCYSVGKKEFSHTL